MEILPDDTPHPQGEVNYIPLLETLRLYAGWLLAWFGAVYTIGAYQHTGVLPFDVPLIEGLFYSPVVLRIAFGTFLFLMLSSMHKVVRRGGMWKVVLLTLLWGIGVVWFGVNV